MGIGFKFAEYRCHQVGRDGKIILLGSISGSENHFSKNRIIPHKILVKKSSKFFGRNSGAESHVLLEPKLTQTAGPNCEDVQVLIAQDLNLAQFRSVLKALRNLGWVEEKPGGAVFGWAAPPYTQNPLEISDSRANPKNFAL